MFRDRRWRKRRETQKKNPNDFKCFPVAKSWHASKCTRFWTAQLCWVLFCPPGFQFLPLVLHHIWTNYFASFVKARNSVGADGVLQATRPLLPPPLLVTANPSLAKSEVKMLSPPWGNVTPLPPMCHPLLTCHPHINHPSPFLLCQPPHMSPPPLRCLEVVWQQNTLAFLVKSLVLQPSPQKSFDNYFCSPVQRILSDEAVHVWTLLRWERLTDHTGTLAPCSRPIFVCLVISHVNRLKWPSYI